MDASFIQNCLANLDKLSQSEQAEIWALLAEIDKAELRETCAKDFMAFVKHVWPNFVEGAHHKTMARTFESVVDGDETRVAINLGPRHTKSEFTSYLLPAWFLGKYPDKKIIQCSNTAELAVGFGRKVRNLVDSAAYREIFPDVMLSTDSKSAGRWSTNSGGEYFAVGVGGTVTGKGADILIIDDPHSEQEAALAVGNPGVYDHVWEWYSSGPRQRLQPGGRILCVMCMTGDTDVLRADGTSTKLRDIRPGDEVATYEAGGIAAARIANWRSSGVDNIYTVTTQSGITLRANERHPFLVDVDGEREWVRLRDLKPGMSLVATKTVSAPRGRSLGPANVIHAKGAARTTRSILQRLSGRLVSMESGRENSAPAANQYMPSACVSLAIASNTRPQSLRRNRTGLAALSTATGLLPSSTTPWCLSVTTAAMSVVCHRALKTLGLTGAASFASTIATRLARFAGFCVTTAISRLAMGARPVTCSAPLSTYSVTLDKIVDISPAGQEEVFDVEVERTENFIANGVVSHNTRWSKRDLTGRILQASIEKVGSDEWELIELPAILDESLPTERSLWPEFWPIDQLRTLRAELPVSKWKAQYQQEPTSESGALIKRDWWRDWVDEDGVALPPPKCKFLLMGGDTAFSKGDRSDFSAFVTFGVFEREGINGKMQDNLILLDAWAERLEFPELKERVRKEIREKKPDCVIIEAKASGAPLVQELRMSGIPVQDFTPTRGRVGESKDKIARTNSVTDILASGMVWCVKEHRYAQEVMDQCAEFPNGDHDDYVDATVMCLTRFRAGGFVMLPGDDQDEPARPRVVGGYY